MHVLINQEPVELPEGASVADAIAHLAPRPPFAATKSSPEDMSRITAPVSASRMTVPLGTLIYSVSPSLPEQRLPSPAAPFPAAYLRL